MSVIGKIKTTKYGEEFAGFPAIKFTFLLLSIMSAGKLGLGSNHRQPTLFQSHGRQNQTIDLDIENISLVGEINEEFLVPYAYACDVLNNNVSLYLTIKQGNKLIYEGDIDEDYIFTPTSYGIYRIIYTAVDGADRKHENSYIVTVKDRIPPIITI